MLCPQEKPPAAKMENPSPLCERDQEHMIHMRRAYLPIENQLLLLVHVRFEQCGQSNPAERKVQENEHVVDGDDDDNNDRILMSYMELRIKFPV
mmetsp:Transcript_11129/g.15442  ORF Transcript_11129/g.15442 Transcript_11129/m.15442 type:complete len:94 (+) Transcript_11129:198-479(+)